MNVTSIALIFEYARTAAFLAVLLFAYADIRSRLKSKSPGLREAWEVLFFVCFTALSMQVAVTVAANVPVNFRTIAVSFAVLFGGPLAGFLAGVTAVLVRSTVGGVSNTPLGILLVLLAYAATLAFRQWIDSRGKPIGVRDLVVLGFGLDLCRVVAWLAIYGYAAMAETVDAAWFDVLLMLPISVVLLGATVLVADERRMLAGSVADSEARFRNVVDQLPFSLTLVDLDDRYTFVNQVHATAMGVPVEEQIGAARQATWNRIGAGPVPRGYLDRVIATGEAVRTDPIEFANFGKIKWIMGTVFPVRNARGEMKEIGSVAVDVTELWITREAIVRRDEMLQRLTTAVVEAVRCSEIGTQPLNIAVQKVTEIAGEALCVERTGVFRFDFDADAVERIDLWERSTGTHFPATPTSRPSLWRDTGLMERNEVFTVEDASTDHRIAGLAEHMRTNKIAAMMAAPIFVNGRFRGIVTFSHVGGTRKWAVEEVSFARSIADIVALIYLNDRYREALAALDLIEDGIYVEESDGRVIYANRVALAMATSKNIKSDLQLPLRAFPTTFPRVQRPLQGDHDRQEMTIDFGAGHCDIQIARSRLPDGGIIVLIRDLTRRNQAQRERQRLENQLLQASKLEAIGQLAGGVAHDFNNLLGAVMGFARFIEEDMPPDSNQHQYANRIIAACDRGQAIVTQITSFSRARNVERRSIDLAGLVRDNRDLLAGLIRPSTSLFTDVWETSLPISANEGQITQILVNLVANANDALEGREGTIAIKMSRVRSGELEVEKEDRQLSLFDDKYRRRRILGELDPTRSYARIDVTDSGKGMSPRIVPRIFEPFYTNKRRTGGTGLGLAVVHSIVSSHDGVMYLDTVEGRGTTFSIYLPVIGEVDAERQERAEAAKNDGTERVLIVDDDVDVADMLSIGLARIGYEVAVSNEPVEALAAFTEDPQGWDVAVVDRMMPEMDGVELAQKLKSIRSDLRIILCTGLDDGLIDPSDEAQGFDLFFIKPVSPDQVAGAIRRLFDGDV